MIKRAQHKTRKVMEVLTDPNPQFVSLVDHGANQTPFAVLKRDGLASPDSSTTPTPDITDMSKPAKQTPAKKEDGAQSPVTLDSGKNVVLVAKGFDIHQMVFRKASFSQEADVNKFLTKNGFSNYEIVDKGDDGYQIDGIALESFEKVDKIELSNGVTYVVGKLNSTEDVVAKEDGAADAPPADAPPADDTTPPAPDADTTEPSADAQEATLKAEDIAPLQELAKKFDTWNASSHATTLAQVAAEAMTDGVPPGYWSVESAFAVAFQNIVRLGNLQLIAPLCAELVQPLTALATLFSSVSKTDTIGADALLASKPPVTVPAQEPVAKSDDTPTPVGVTKEEVAALVSDALKEMQTKMDEALVALKEEVVAKADADSLIAPVRESIAKHDTRLARVERVRQVRKSDEALEAGQPSGPSGEGQKPEPADKQEFVSKSDANLFGIRSHDTRPKR